MKVQRKETSTRRKNIKINEGKEEEEEEFPWVQCTRVTVRSRLETTPLCVLIKNVVAVENKKKKKRKKINNERHTTHCRKIYLYDSGYELMLQSKILR